MCIVSSREKKYIPCAWWWSFHLIQFEGWKDVYKKNLWRNAYKLIISAIGTTYVMVDLKYQVIGPCLCYKDIVHPTSEPNKYFPPIYL